MTNYYGTLKHHFQKIFKAVGTQSPWRNNGLEPIRTVYEDMFGRKLGLYDIYETMFRVPNNPIAGIITIVGPEPGEDDPEIITGILPYRNELVYVNFIPNDIYKGIENLSMDSANLFIWEIYEAISRIVSYDPIYSSRATDPYNVFLHVLPLYLTFHIVAHDMPEVLYAEELNDLIERYYSSEQEKLYQILVNSNYYPDIERIYATMTEKGTFDPLD